MHGSSGGQSSGQSSGQKVGVRTHILDNITLQLAREYDAHTPWIGSELAVRQLRAAWMRLTNDDSPMNPRLIGRPGVGKTTLAVAVAQQMNLPVFLMQATSDTRPEDLIITPVVSEGKQISYVASPLVTAAIIGGVCVLDEGNRMSEKSWASLAALLDHRRYVDSLVTGVRIQAHRDFRFVTTMNDDSSVYDLPEYIQSRLNPQIYVDFADSESESKIIRMAVPYIEDDLLNTLVAFLAAAHAEGESYSVRDGIQIGKYAARIRNMEPAVAMPHALLRAIQAVLGNEAAVRITSLKGDGSGRPPLRPV